VHNQSLFDWVVTDDTLVIFLSDNGRAFAGAKTTLYDEGIHLPLIIRAPHATPGARSEAMASWSISPQRSSILPGQRVPSRTNCTADRYCPCWARHVRWVGTGYSLPTAFTRSTSIIRCAPCERLVMPTYSTWCTSCVIRSRAMLRPHRVGKRYRQAARNSESARLTRISVGPPRNYTTSSPTPIRSPIWPAAPIIATP
jgi:hypothetical protein